MQKKAYLGAVLIVSIFFTSLTTCFAAQQIPRKTLAVLYFQNNSLADRQNMDPLRKGLADMLITELSKIQALKVIERSQLQQMIEEMKLGQSGLVDEQTAQKVGRLLGAQTLLLGSYVVMFGGKMRIDARIVEVETGRTLEAEEVTGKVKDLFKMVQKLSRKIAKALDVKLTKGDKKRLKTAQNKSFDAALYYSRGLELEDTGKWEQAKAMFEQALKINPKYTSAREELAKIQSKEK
ncbi:MAG: tetratricopeptide repeat protein [Calditrichaeota bacterium]|nr:tetratricopeptide repeat protein [Calditrichota bacterium]